MTKEIGADAKALLEGLGEPALIVDRNGLIASINSAGRVLLGSDAKGQPLRDISEGDCEGLKKYLDRCLGSSHPLVGVLHLRSESGRIQCRGTRVLLSGSPWVLLRVGRFDENRFAALSRKVLELNQEVKERRRAEVVLAEALAERDLLLRELQHRVKNNMHMLSSLLRGAERETRNIEAKRVLRDACVRFSAVNSVHQLIYSADELESIDSQALVKALTNAAVQLTPTQIQVDLEVSPWQIPIKVAVPVALIINELLTNAVKYGHPAEGRQMIRIEWKNSGETINLMIEDNGPGFEFRDTAKRASGIGLVLGLLRQLGGSLRVERTTGARCTAQFLIPRLTKQAL